ncbi:MAG: hypothetical protein GF347_03090 [Candidatus Moranbacteria bacterium]|nr:hypothetical protein [Candidatus Moranbacteria bacterium]
MSDSILIENLKRQVEEKKSAGIPDNVIMNFLKEELQYYVLNFIYNDKDYSQLIMYGGTLLRMAYGLNRMSEDLDFQTAKKINLSRLKKDLEGHFKSSYNLKTDVVLKERPESPTKLLKINFDILKNFHLKNINWTVLKIRFDINIFEKSGNFITDVIPITRDQHVFSIKTYPLSTLMASKILAVLNRTKRIIKGKKSKCKPRDIYDLIWYLEKGIYPDIEYLKAYGKKYQNILDLFGDLKKRVANLDDNLFETDLAQFFFDRTNYDQWFSNWRQRFVNLMNGYSIYEVGNLEKIHIWIQFETDNRHIRYIFKELHKKTQIQFEIKMAFSWFEDSSLRIGSGQRVEKIENRIEKFENISIREVEYEYLGLFYKKILDFIKRSNGVLLQNEYKTKLIRTTADNFNPKEQIYLDIRLLEKIQFEELI